MYSLLHVDRRAGSVAETTSNPLQDVPSIDVRSRTTSTSSPRHLPRRGSIDSIQPITELDTNAPFLRAKSLSNVFMNCSESAILSLANDAKESDDVTTATNSSPKADSRTKQSRMRYQSSPKSNSLQDSDAERVGHVTEIGPQGLGTAHKVLLCVCVIG